MKRTTNLGELRTGDLFKWGEIIEFYHIAEYNIASYHPWKVEGAGVLVGEPEKDIILYHCWVDSKNVGRSCDSLDGAIAFCIAYKHGEPASAEYFIKMLAN